MLVLVEKYSRAIERISGAVQHHPLLLSLYVLTLIALMFLSLLALAGKDEKRQVAAAIAIFALSFFVVAGEDTVHHVLRIVALSAQLKGGTASLMLTNPSTGNAYPVFVYYSLVPYLPAALLNLAGVPALWALQVTLLGAFLILATGLRSMFTELRRSWPQLTDPLCNSATILFISSNYVCGLWVTRAALGESLAYALAPWAVTFLLDSRKWGMLTLVLALQVCIHPLVFAHCMLCQIVVGLACGGLERRAVVGLLMRCGLAAAVALALGSAFWLPQLVFLDDVLGLRGIPVSFTDSFLTPGELLDPSFPRNLGLFLPAAILFLAVRGRRIGRSFWFLACCFAVLLAAQTVFLREITVHVPTLQQSQFVWRLMFPTAFIGLGALAVGSLGSKEKEIRAMKVLTSISLLIFVSTQIIRSPWNLTYIGTFAAAEDLAAQIQVTNVWGIRLFAPNYERLPDGCAKLSSGVQATTYAALLTGITAAKEFIAVEDAPVGVVRYRAADQPAALSFCNRQLLLGPVSLGTRLWVDETALRWLLFGRIGTILAVMILILGSSMVAIWRQSERGEAKSVA